MPEGHTIIILTVVALAAMAHPDPQGTHPTQQSNDRDLHARKNAELTLRVLRDPYLESVRAEVLHCGGDAAQVSSVISAYQRSRDSAIAQVVELWARDPGEDVYAQEFKRIREAWPRGEPWDPSRAEEAQRHSKEVEAAAVRATEESGIVEKLFAVGRQHAVALRGCASAASDIVAATGNLPMARRLHWTILCAHLDSPDPARGPSPPFQLDVDVFKLWSECAPRPGPADGSLALLEVDAFGLPCGGDAVVVEAIDRVLETGATAALLWLRLAQRDSGLLADDQLRKAFASRWAAQDRFVEVIVEQLRMRGQLEAANNVGAAQLKALAPTVARSTWIEVDAAACLDALEKQVGADAERLLDARRVVGEAIELVQSLRQETVRAGMIARVSVGSHDAVSRLERVVTAMEKFDAAVAESKLKLKPFLPPQWETLIPAELSGRAAGFQKKESSVDSFSRMQQPDYAR